jgi:hypothetical protein
MADLLPKNLWVYLTVIIPGLVTYGSWRLLLLSRGDWNINMELLFKVDDSTFLSTCFVTAIAILQQALAITLEFFIGVLCAITVGKDRCWGQLFLGRFKMVSEGKVSEDGKRTIGQFFLSVNVLVGQLYLVLYFLLFEDVEADSGLAIVLYCAFGAVLLTCAFRAWNAKEIVLG